MEEQVFKELKEIRKLLAELIGVPQQPITKGFSKEAIAKAERDYRKMAT